MGKRHWSSPMWKDTRKPSIWKDGRQPRTVTGQAVKGAAEGAQGAGRGVWQTFVALRRLRRWF